MDEILKRPDVRQVLRVDGRPYYPNSIRISISLDVLKTYGSHTGDSVSLTYRERGEWKALNGNVVASRRFENGDRVVFVNNTSANSDLRDPEFILWIPNIGAGGVLCPWVSQRVKEKRFRKRYRAYPI